jgi:FtsP/CotA-like multicopper oxidase with cupredoxin domain
VKAKEKKQMAGKDRSVRPCRREFLQAAAMTAGGLFVPAGGSHGWWPGFPNGELQQPAQKPGSLSNPDFSIEIAELEWELAPKKKIRTTAYGGQVPGKLLRMTEGRPVTIEIANNSTHPEIVHWHGQWIPSDVDGSMEEGTPMIAPGVTARIGFTPAPSGLHWYHTHVSAKRDLKNGLYSAQFGMVYIEPSENPGRYDDEHFLTLHDWDPYFVSSDDGSQMVDYGMSSINGRMLGHDAPIQVHQGQRVLFHVLNASATMAHSLALPGHRFQVVALDGRPVSTQASVETLRLGPAERVSALVTMDHPGVWILGETNASYRQAGLGTTVEYAGHAGEAQWHDPAQLQWDYAIFGDANPVARKPDLTIPLIFTSKFEGHGALDRWMINGKSYPETETPMLQTGLRHRLVFDNRSTDDHPVHLHRHAFELVSLKGKATSGVFKDVVIVGARSKVEVDLVASNPGKTLFHCHQQDHMDSGFMMLFDYAQKVPGNPSQAGESK